MRSPLPFVNQLHTFFTAHKALLAHMHAKATAVQRCGATVGAFGV